MMGNIMKSKIGDYVSVILKVLIIGSFLLITMYIIAPYVWGKQVYNFSTPAIMFQLGDENKDKEIPMVIHVNGEIKRNLWRVRTFTGTIRVEGDSIPFPEDKRELTLRLDNNGYSDMTYRYYDPGSPHAYPYGGIFINRDFSKIAIWKYETNELNTDHRSWSSENGHMITAPADNREEANQVSNELLNHASFK